MERVKRLLLPILLVVASGAFWGNAQLVSFTPSKMTLQLLAKIKARQLVDGNIQLSMLDSIQSIQTRIMTYSMSLNALTQAYHASMRNIDGFGEESAKYRQIFSDAQRIGEITPKLIGLLYSNTGENCLKLCFALGDITAEAASLMSAYISICANGSILNPLAHYGGVTENDGYNFMSRQDRIETADAICNRMMLMRRACETLYIKIKTIQEAPLLKVVDAKSFYNAQEGSRIAEQIRSDFKNLGRK